MGRPKAAWNVHLDRILHRIELTGCSQTDAIEAELPGLSDEDARTWAGRVRIGVHRRRKAGLGTRLPQPERGPTPAAPTTPAPAVPTTHRADPADDHPAVELERIPSLRRQLSQTERALEAVIEDRQWRHYSQLDARRSAAAEELERELERVRQVVSLDPRPGAIMEWLDGQREFVERGADLERRRLARLAAK